MIEYRDLQAAPFVDGGRDPKIGLDCWGLLMVVMERFGYRVPDFQVSCFKTDMINGLFASETGDPISVDSEVRGMWKRADEPTGGRAVALRIDPMMPNMVQHYGVCLDKHKFIHTLQKTGVLVTRLDHRFFANKIVGFYEWIG